MSLSDAELLDGVASSNERDRQDASIDVQSADNDAFLRLQTGDRISQPVSDPSQDGASSEGSQYEDEDDEDRPNRFQGPDSTWRFYTEDERSLIASLDQVRANDLSVHLYNAHALKARLYDPETAASTKPWQSKKHWMRPSEDGKLPWHPDQKWTAWPLSADDVPRKDEVFGKTIDDFEAEQSTLRKPMEWRPSADLVEELEALMLKQAKERFRSRDWEMVEQTKAEEVAQVPDNERGVAHLISDQRDTSGNKNNDSGLSREERSRMHADAPTIDGDGGQVSCFSTDDEKAAEILRPSVRHVVSQLDDLLLALHKSRLGQHRNSGSASQSRSVSRSSTQARKRKRVTSETKYGSASSAGSDEQADSGEKEASSAGTTGRRSDRGSRLGTRDWSEVLGMASLIGWDQAVVDRAARRCASLFGEGMIMRTMPHDATEPSHDRVTDCVPDMVPIPDTALQSDGSDSGSGAQSEVSEEGPTESYVHPINIPFPRGIDAAPRLKRSKEEQQRTRGSSTSERARERRQAKKQAMQSDQDDT